MNIFSNILQIFNKEEKRNLIFLFFLMLLAAFLETLGIGLIIPFIGIVTNPEMINNNEYLVLLYDLLRFQSIKAFLIFTTIVFLLIFVVKNLYILMFYNFQFKFVNNQRAKKSQILLQAYLTKPYEFHLQRNTAELLRNVNTEVYRVFREIMIPGFVIATEILVIICILGLLLFMEPIVTLLSALLLGISVIMFFKVFRKKINTIGRLQQESNGQMIKWINQGLGANKEIKVSGNEAFFINSFKEQSKIFAHTERYYQMLSEAPRLFIETMVVATILSVVLAIILRGDNLTSLLSTMALFAMAAFRLMPSINRIVGSLTTIRYNYPALNVIHEDLIEGMSADKKVTSTESPPLKDLSNKAFQHEIELKDISYRYPNQSDYAIKNVSLKIPIGSSVAFVGTSGAGKTTLVDIILGILAPARGSILIDGINQNETMALWKRKIGYIPQAIYLSDDSIRRNIAFGIDNHDIDDQRVWNVLEEAHLKDFIKSLPEGLDTFVGERGVRLSGGQRQRIGIARALYNNPEILFMDEATSALDNETEKEIMKAIDDLKGKKTLIIIAHRLSTIENCDILFEMQDGKLIKETASIYSEKKPLLY